YEIGQCLEFSRVLFRSGRGWRNNGRLRWSREQAIDWMVAATGRARAAVTSEVDRYCASPGQACGYKVGQLLGVERPALDEGVEAEREGGGEGRRRACRG